MPAFIYANNINTTLAAPITSTTQTTVTLTSTAHLPTIAAGQVLALTLNDAATQSVFEVLYCTARSGATLTVTRGQEGTAATTWLSGDYAYASVTAGMLGNFAPTSTLAAFGAGLSVTGPLTNNGVSQPIVQRGNVSIAIASGQSTVGFQVVFPVAFTAVPRISLTFSDSSGSQFWTSASGQTAPGLQATNVGSAAFYIFIYGSTLAASNAAATYTVDWVATQA